MKKFLMVCGVLFLVLVVFGGGFYLGQRNRRVEEVKINSVRNIEDKHGERMAKEAGANDFLEKPFEMDDLLAMAEKYLK